MMLCSSLHSYKKVLFLILVLLLLGQTLLVLLHKRDSYSNEISSKNILKNLDEISKVSINLFQIERDNKNSNILYTTDKEIRFSSYEETFNSVSLPIGKQSSKTTFRKRKRISEIDKSTLNIFFIESKCGTLKSAEKFNTSSFLLSPRQCCAVESAATLNPGRPVYILHTCPVTLLRLPEYAQRLLALPNVHVVHLDATAFLRESPLRSLHQSGRLEASLYPVVHASDLLRLVALWRFGGTYCDLDILSLRSLDELVLSNFCGLESHKAIGNSMLNFHPHGYGHKVVTKMLQHAAANFNGSIWAANGPDLVSKVILQECNANISTVAGCAEFTVYRQPVLYPLPWRQHWQMFNASLGGELVRQVKGTGVVVHLWNKFTSAYGVRVGSSQPYALLADEFCPGAYRNCGHSF